jgi:hypothetical protein
MIQGFTAKSNKSKKLKKLKKERDRKGQKGTERKEKVKEGNRPALSSFLYFFDLFDFAVIYSSLFLVQPR